MNLRRLIAPPHGPAAALVAVLVLAALVRLAPWEWVLGGPELRLVGDGDPLYHLVQAERLLTEPLAALWRDPLLNWPAGADAAWPPLFDVLLALAGRVAALGATPDRGDLLLAGAVVPVLLGVLMVWLVARLGRALLGGGPWLDAAAILAVLPAHAQYTVLGRPDQHAAEPLVAGLVVLAAARIAAGGGRRPVALLAGAVALGFWTWSGSALLVGLAAGFAAAWHAAAPAEDAAVARGLRGLAAGLLGAAALLTATLLLFGPPGALASARIAGLTGLQAAFAAGAAGVCGLVALARRLRPGAGAAERAAAAAVAIAAPLAAIRLAPWSGAAFDRGITMLAADGWYRSITEFEPLLLGGTSPLRAGVELVLSDHGLALLAVPAALPLLWGRWRAAPPAARAPSLLAALVLAGSLALAVARRRFALYLSVAEALSLALLARALAGALARRWPARAWAGPAAGVALVAAALAPVLPDLAAASWAARYPVRDLDVAPLLRLARHETPPGREAILAPWSWGHDARWFSGRPVVSSPFGIEGGPGAVEDDAAFHLETDPDEVEALLARRRVGFVLVTSPLDEVVSLGEFVPGRPPLVRTTRDPVSGIEVRVNPQFASLVVARLHLFDGMSGNVLGSVDEAGGTTLGGFRLVAESAGLEPWLGRVSVPRAKLFQVVAGVTVRVPGLSPGTRVEARARIVTNVGRRVSFAVRGAAGPDGVASLRLPYALGSNGLVTAGPWLVSDGRRSAAVVLGEAEVVLGGAREVRLAATP